MRILMTVGFPHATFNAAVKDGSAGPKTNAILESLKPEAVYFTEFEGRRTAVLIVELETPSKIPALAEPWFLGFDADVELHPIMSPEELEQAGLEELGKRWG